MTTTAQPYFPVDLSKWGEIREQLLESGPFTQAAAETDLRWWHHRVFIELCRPPHVRDSEYTQVPGRGRLAEMWGWNKGVRGQTPNAVHELQKALEHPNGNPMDKLESAGRTRKKASNRAKTRSRSPGRDERRQSDRNPQLFQQGTEGATSSPPEAAADSPPQTRSPGTDERQQSGRNPQPDPQPPAGDPQEIRSSGTDERQQSGRNPQEIRSEPAGGSGKPASNGRNDPAIDRVDRVDPSFLSSLLARGVTADEEIWLRALARWAAPGRPWADQGIHLEVELEWWRETRRKRVGWEGLDLTMTMLKWSEWLASAAAETRSDKPQMPRWPRPNALDWVDREARWLAERTPAPSSAPRRAAAARGGRGGGRRRGAGGGRQRFTLMTESAGE